MNNCLAGAELTELGTMVLSGFDHRIGAIPKDLCAPFRAEARNLETEIAFFYRTVAMCARKTENLAEVSSLWSIMAETCGQALVRLSDLKKQHPACNASDYFDRICDIRAKAERLREMHA